MLYFHICLVPVSKPFVLYFMFGSVLLNTVVHVLSGWVKVIMIECPIL